MDGNITVHVVEPGSSISPNTGLFMGGSNTSILLSVILVLIILAQIPIFIYTKKHDKRIRLSRILEVKTSLVPAFISLLTLTALIATNINATDINESNLPITVDNTDLTVELGNEPVFAYMPVTIKFKEATPAGYSLTAHADSTELVSITDSTNKIV